MNSICQFTITLLDPSIEITLINLSLVNKETILNELSILNYSDEDTFYVFDLFINDCLLSFLVYWLKMFVEPDLFPFERFRVTLSKT